MTRTEEGILLLDPNPEDIILQNSPIAGRTIALTEVTVGSPEVTVQPDPQPEGPKLHLGYLGGTMTDF